MEALPLGDEVRASTSAVSPTTCRVLFVCTANLCRSPMAELLMRHALQQRRDHALWQVASVGINAVPGRRIHPKAAITLDELGVDHSAFRSRSIGSEELSGFDIILTSTRDQRAAIVRSDPRVLTRTFTIRQLGYLLEAAEPLSADDAGAIGDSLIDAARRARAVRRARLAEDDLDDPVSEPQLVFRQCAGILTDNIAAILAVVPDSDPPNRKRA